MSEATSEAGGSAPPETVQEARESRFSFLNDQIEIRCPTKDANGQDSVDIFRFKIPTMAMFTTVSSRALAIRREQDPSKIGTLAGLDREGADMIWGFAAFEVLLVSSSCKWPWTDGPKGQPYCDHKNFPFSKTNEFLIVVYELDAALARFREQGPVNDGPVPPKTVGAGQNTGA